MLTAQHMVQPSAHHIYRSNGSKDIIGSMLQVPDRDICTKIISNEQVRLTQDNIYGVCSTDTLNFIQQHKAPRGRDIPYDTYILSHKPLKEEELGVQIIVGGDRLTYLDNTGSHVANLLETKILINSVISNDWEVN